MTALLLQYLKLIMLFLLIGTVIGLSHFGESRNGSGLATARQTHSPARARRIPVVSGHLAAAADGAAIVRLRGIGNQRRLSRPSFG